MAAENVDRFSSVGCLNYGEAFLLEAVGKGFAEYPLIVDDQDRSSHPSPSYGLGAACAVSFSTARSSLARVRS